MRFCVCVFMCFSTVNKQPMSDVPCFCVPKIFIVSTSNTITPVFWVISFHYKNKRKEKHMDDDYTFGVLLQEASNTAPHSQVKTVQNKCIIYYRK